MSEINLNNYKIRTDLVEEIQIGPKKSKLIDDIDVSNITISKKDSLNFDKIPGTYITISFKDITDTNNYKKVLNIFETEFKKILNILKIKDSDTCLIVGLGNDKVTPDSLGPKVIDNCIATRHIYTLVGKLEKGYKVTSKIAPGVMGTTGIETIDIIKGVIEKIKPDFLIVIDSLAASKVERLMKTIQISTAGINPGSGIGNNREELSYKSLKVKTIAIGVPFVCDAVTICYDTINFMLKHFSYNIYNHNLKDKLIPIQNRNFLNHDLKQLSFEEKSYFLGAFGGLSDSEKRILISDVLTPIGYNLMVTTKEVDFLLDKLSNLLATGINNCLHNLK